MTSNLVTRGTTTELWRHANLGEHVEILSGFAFDSKLFSDSGGVPLIRIRDVVRGRTETRYIGNYDSRFVTQTGDLLIGMDGDFNRALWSSEPALLNQRVCKITASAETLDQRYLYHFLPGALLEIWHQTPFATVKHLSVKGIRAIKIPLPPLGEQRRIAAILDKADELRSKRRQAIAHLDALTQSIFHSMFGAFQRSNVLSDAVSDLVGGKNLVGADDSTNSYRVLKISAVTSGRYIESESKPLPVDYAPARNHLVRTGDVLISRANTAELVGASALVNATNGTTMLPDKLWRAVPAPGIAPRFLVAALQTRETRDQISRVATGSGGSMKNISKPKLLSVPFVLPPAELQQAFATRVAAVERLKETHHKHLAELDALFASLQSRAFRGEL